METELLRDCDLCGSLRLTEIDGAASVCRCEACGLVFDNPRPTIDELVRFYSTPGKYDDWLMDEVLRHKLWLRRLKLMRKDFHPGNVLDVGSGIGQFVKLAGEHYEPATGTEVSTVAITIARERYGVELHEGELLNLDLPIGAFDNITMFHVLEHVPSPRVLLERAHELLRPGGHLYIAVPNDVPAAYQREKAVPATNSLGLDKIHLDGSMSEIHLSHFRPEVLRDALARRGFIVKRQTLDPYFVASGLRRVKAEGRLVWHRVASHLASEIMYDTSWTVAVRQ